MMLEWERTNTAEEYGLALSLSLSLSTALANTRAQTRNCTNADAGAWTDAQLWVRINAGNYDDYVVIKG